MSDYLKLLKQIEQQHFEPLYVLHGEEPYFIDALSNAIEMHGLSDEDRAFNAYVLYGKDTDVNQVAGFARQFPMTGNRVLVIVREAQNLKGIVKGLTDDDVETANSKNDLLDYVKHPSPHTILVLCYKYKTIDKRTTLYKLAQKNGIVFESKKLYDNQIPDWINNYVKSLHMGIHPRAAFLLSEACGSDLSRLVLEIEKIKVNLQPGQAIDIEHVEQHVGISKDYNVFELQDAIAQRHIEKALKITFVFAANEKEHPLPLLLAMLYGFFTKVMRVHFINDKSHGNIAKALGINPFFAKTYVTACGYYNLTKLKDIFKALKDCDLKSKGILPSGAGHAALLQDLMITILY